MKKILLLINQPEKPYSTFANILKPFLEKTGQFEIEVTHDRNRLVELSAFDAVGLYIAGGSFTPEQERGLADFVSNGGGLLAVHGCRVRYVIPSSWGTVTSPPNRTCKVSPAYGSPVRYNLN